MKNSSRYPGFTLVETIAVILVLGVLAGVTAPLMVGASRSYADARDGRRAIEDAAFALERVVRILREAPSGATAGEPSFTKATAAGFGLTGGAMVGVDGTDLTLTIGGSEGPLCRDVTVFELTYRGADGATLNFGAGDLPEQTQRIDIRLVAAGQELRTTAFLRCTLERES